MYFRLGELFCGPGGIAKGAISAKIDNSNWGIVHAWANDYDQSTCDTYAYNICPDNPKSVICQDVHTLDIEKLGAIDALAFGAPCNDFSVVGKQKGIDFLMEKQIQKLYPDLDMLCQRLDRCVMKKQKKRKKNFLKDLLTSSQSIKKC